MHGECSLIRGEGRWTGLDCSTTREGWAGLSDRTSLLAASPRLFVGASRKLPLGRGELLEGVEGSRRLRPRPLKPPLWSRHRHRPPAFDLWVASLSTHHQFLGTDKTVHKKVFTAIPSLASVDRLTADGVRAWINTDSFTKHLKWNLVWAPPNCEGNGHDGAMHHLGGYPHHLITLGVGPLLAMLNPEISSTQAAAARLSLATTVSVYMAGGLLLWSC